MSCSYLQYCKWISSCTCWAHSDLVYCLAHWILVSAVRRSCQLLDCLAWNLGLWSSPEGIYLLFWWFFSFEGEWFHVLDFWGQTHILCVFYSQRGTGHNECHRWPCCGLSQCHSEICRLLGEDEGQFSNCCCVWVRWPFRREKGLDCYQCHGVILCRLPGC